MKLTLIASIEIDVEDYRQGEDAVRKVYAGIWDLLPHLKQPPTSVTLFAPNGSALRTINASTRLTAAGRGRKIT